MFPDGAGKVMLPDSKIRWEVHMHAIGEIVEDSKVELGVWFYDKGNEPANRTRLKMFDARGRNSLDIPPGEVAVTQQFHVLKWPSRLENFQPHMRGKIMTMEAVYPDGRTEILSQADNFQWNWHINYIYADHVAPPAAGRHDHRDHGPGTTTRRTTPTTRIPRSGSDGVTVRSTKWPMPGSTSPI